MPESKWEKEANRRWGKKGYYIEGDGPFAVLAWCGRHDEMSYSLWQTREEAEREKAFIDRSGCGGSCIRHHEILEMTKSN